MGPAAPGLPPPPTLYIPPTPLYIYGPHSPPNRLFARHPPQKPHHAAGRTRRCTCRPRHLQHRSVHTIHRSVFIDVNKNVNKNTTPKTTKKLGFRSPLNSPTEAPERNVNFTLYLHKQDGIKFI